MTESVLALSLIKSVSMGGVPNNCAPFVFRGSANSVISAFT